MKNLTSTSSHAGDPTAGGATLASGMACARSHPLERLEWPGMLDWLEQERSRGEAVAAWSDPEQGLEWVASGVAYTFEASDLQELEAIRSSLSELTGDPTPAELPLAWVGAAFDPRQHSGAWEGWPAAVAVVPRRLVWVQRAPAAAPAPDPAGEEWPQPEAPRAAAGVLVRAEDPARADAELAATLAALRAPTARRASRPAALERHAPEAPDSWAARVRAAVEAAGRAELAKVVLARAVARSLPATSRWDVGGTLRQLRQDDPHAIVYAFALPGDVGCFLGATPELLVRVRGRRVEAVALAGTARRGRDEADDRSRAAALLASDKDQREHALVSQAIRGVLRPACRLFHQPQRPGLRTLPRLLHLETRFLGILSEPGRALELAAALHPSPAVAGTPREAALAWLRAHEPVERGWFAGPVGWVDGRGGGTLAVALRCALLRGPVAWSFAGAGIVPGSDAAAEWLETEGKLATIARALQVSDLPPPGDGLR